jgi:hypothetical protein
MAKNTPLRKKELSLLLWLVPWPNPPNLPISCFILSKRYARYGEIK